jgi:hypothetical protein
MEEFTSNGYGFNEFDGLIKVQRIMIPSLVDSKQIVPIQEYVASNDIWSGLPGYFTENGKYNGVFWGIPASSNGLPSIKTRLIRSDWLDKLAGDVPETLDEFYECMKHMTFNDPDGNGYDDTVGLVSNGLAGLYDIFNAYDSNIGYFRPYQQAWDPLKNEFIDGLQQEHAAECLEFLHECYEEKLIHPLFDTIGYSDVLPEYYKGKAGSLIHYISNADNIEAEMGIAHSLAPGIKGNRTQKLVPAYSGSEEFYVLSEGTDDKQNTLDCFIDVFLGNELGYFMGMYGIPDTIDEVGDFSISNEVVTLNVDIEGNEVVKGETPSIIKGHPVYSKYEINYSKADKSTYPGNVISNHDRNFVIDTLAKHEDLIYIMPHKYQDIERMYCNIDGENIREDIHILGTNIIIDCIKGKVDIEDSIEEYKKTVEKMGLNDIIENVNLIVKNGTY